MLIGERPGETEARVGRPFCGPTGEELDKYLKMAGVMRELAYITNLVKDYRGGEKPEDWEIERDWPELMQEFRSVKPQVVGLLGTYTVETVLDVKRAELERTHGVPVWSADGAHIYLPMIHPAAGLYSPESQPAILSDFLSLSAVLKGKLAPVEDSNVEVQYGEISRSGLPNDWKVSADCAVDTEGSWRRPWCLTFSTTPGRASMLRPPCSVSFRGRVSMHNSLHDLNVLKAMGITVGDEQFVDTMILAYVLGLEPKGLKELAYRHLGMEMQSYNEVMGEANAQVAREYIEGVGAGVWPEAEEYIEIEYSKKHGKQVPKIHRPWSIGKRVGRLLADISKGPGDVDIRDRWNNIESRLRLPVERVLGPMPEATLDDIPLARATHYANRDADATLRLTPILEGKVEAEKLTEVAEMDHSVIPMLARMVEVGCRIAPPEYWERLSSKCETAMQDECGIINKLTGHYINPGSSKQTGELLYGRLKLDRFFSNLYAVTTEGGAISTNDKALEEIVDAHPVVDHILSYRTASKVKSTYSDPFYLLATVDARVRSDLRSTTTPTGRFTASEPNLLALPLRSDLGKEVRGGIVASEGCVLGDWDLDQIEMRVMAHLSQDKEMCRVFREGKVDIHSNTAALMFGKNVHNVTKMERLSGKTVGFGIVNQITSHGLVRQMYLFEARRPDGSKWTEAQCQEAIQEWFRIYSGVGNFIMDCRRETQHTGKVRDMWGRLRYLPGALSSIPRIREEALRQASSHEIQAGANGVFKHALKVIWDEVIKPANKRGHHIDPWLPPHDELLMEMSDDKELKRTVDREVVRAMQETTILRVPIGAKGSYGQNWMEIH